MSCAEQECYLIVHVCSRDVSIYVLSSLKYCSPVCLLSTESHLGLLDSIVRSVERCEGELLCCLGHRRKVSALCLPYAIYHRVDNPRNEYLNHFDAVQNTRASAALGELPLVFLLCRTD